MGSLIEMYGGAASDAPLPLLQSLMASLDHHNAFNTQNKDEMQTLTSAISNLMGQAKTRYRGLMLLNGLLDAGAMQQEVIVAHGHVWLPLCVKSLRPAEVPSHEKSLAYSVISKLLKQASKVHELDRSAITSSIVDIIENIEKAPAALHIPAVLCLESLLLSFSKTCGPHKTQIERFLVQFFDSHDTHTVICAAKCAHLLQQVRGGGERGMVHKTAWKYQLSMLVNSANDIVKKIYSVTNNERSYETMSYFVSSNGRYEPPQTNNNIENTPFYIVTKDLCAESNISNILKRCSDADGDDDLSITNKKIMHICKLFTRLKNVLTFIQAMLVEPFPVPKGIKCSEILEVALRCLGLSCKLSNEKHTLELTTVTSQVPSLYIYVLRTLEALMISIRTNILPHLGLLLKMILQVLDTTKVENYCSGPKPYKNVRIAAYNTMCLLFSTVSTFKPPLQEGDNSFEDRLLKNILDDISYSKPSLQLTIKDTGSLKNMSKRARNKLNMNQLMASNLPQNTSGNVANSSSSSTEACVENSDLINSALYCLESFFKSSGMFLKQNSHRMVQEAVLKQVYSRSTHKASRMALLQTLSAIQSYQSTRQPTVVSYCLNALSRHQSMPDIELKTFCKSALHQCMTSIRGSIPPLDLPMVKPADFDEYGVFDSNVSNGTSLTNSSNNIIDIENAASTNTITTSEQPKRKSDDNDSVNSKEKKRKKAAPLLIVDSSSDDDCTILEPAYKSPQSNQTHSTSTITTDDIIFSNNHSEAFMLDTLPYVGESIVRKTVEDIVDEIRYECDPPKDQAEECLNIPNDVNPEKENELTAKNDENKITDAADSNKESESLNNAANDSNINLEEIMSTFVDEVNDEYK